MKKANKHGETARASKTTLTRQKRHIMTVGDEVGKSNAIWKQIDQFSTIVNKRAEFILRIVFMTFAAILTAGVIVKAFGLDR
ncbi:hypothetical protein [Brucella sp. JSBI001]|uniref:hypothetical protein n=1 Tax=Brucella sp. JSBI001 TaxID=2886044 RepID=UPI00223113C6|nr:hypothetical protein [Brucella sp. JSBI001]UZD70892.1 hypothetical protein LJ361_05600 [Brucella sp. JSBI001]